ncbi:membrane protein [Candidatus Magnetomorum sp. HK-1]|nr:membrane protein [Candidatus Magnetomorum sp. HK-1]
MIFDHLDLFLPIALVVLSFLLKLFIDQNVTAPLIIKSLYELPVDILFLAMSFIVAFTLSSYNNINYGLIYLFIFFIIILFSILGWRRSIKLFENNKKIISAIIFIINFNISSFCLISSVNLIIGA